MRRILILLSVIFFLFNASDIIAQGNQPSKPDADKIKKEITEHVNLLYSRNIDLLKEVHSTNLDRQTSQINMILTVASLLFAVLFAGGFFLSRRDQKQVDELIESKTKSLRDELNFKSKEIEDLERKIKGFEFDIELIRKDIVWTNDLNDVLRKIFSADSEKVIDGLNKITEKYYYSPLVHRKLENLKDSTHEEIKLCALRALAIYGDNNALDVLREMAVSNDNATTTLKYLEEEYPGLFKSSQPQKEPSPESSG